MKTQKEYMNSIKVLFNEHVTANKSKLDAYSYCNSDAIYCFKDFISNVRTLGLEFSDVYHANGIGNNNEYKIYLKEIDKDGFFIQKNIAEFYYCTGIYGGCYASLKDFATGEKIAVGKVS